MIRVVLAEDNVLLRDGLVRLFAEADDIDVVAAVGDFDEAWASIEEHGPDVVVTDIRMPPTDGDEGLRLAAQLTDRDPTTGVVVLSHHLDSDYAVRLLEAGTQGRAYLLKDRVGDPEELHRAVRLVAVGDSMIDPAVVDALLSARREGLVGLHRLSERESEVLQEMARGLNNRSISEQLGVSERAVEKHASSIFLKLGLSEETEINRRVAAVLVFLGAAR